MRSSNSSKACVRTLRDGDQIRRCKNLIACDQNTLASAATTFTVCASPVRLAIMKLLEAEGELCVCDLAEILELSVPGVSQQLRKLKDAGAVTSRRAGNTIYHSRVPEFRQRLVQSTDLLAETQTI
ncbi:ArsR/SmtB family transcription factor [Neolewinella agarilytica]|uniref:Transcriptional regulator, ArsR family n=1 Tax=Neolewinella agarilytica TaxID=478744 RepID=A0A1H9H555_9BACT|nr:transcriptional regulator, ArsR family [Neolewinella agarilytica]